MSSVLANHQKSPRRLLQQVFYPYTESLKHAEKKRKENQGNERDRGGQSTRALAYLSWFSFTELQLSNDYSHETYQVSLERRSRLLNSSQEF